MRCLLPIAFVACGAREPELRPARPPAPPQQEAPPATIGDELRSCERQRDGAIEVLAESSRLLRECQVEVAQLRAPRGDTIASKPGLPADEPADEPAHEGGWWCVEALAAQSDSGCARSAQECQGLADEIRAATLMVPGRCQWQPRAACFVLHAKLSGVTKEICSSLLSSCDTHRLARRQQSRDYQVKSPCRAKP